MTTTTRTLGALLALLLGCSGEAMPLDASTMTACAPGESRACACSSGAMGAQVCEGDGSELGPCVCAVDDGGLEELDAGSRRPPYVDPLDAGVSPDAGPSFVEVDGGPADAGPVWRDAGPDACNLVTRAGCGSFEACRMSWHGPVCEPSGSMDDRHDGPCLDADHRDLCTAGWFCRPSQGCIRYCEPGGLRCPPTQDGRPQTCHAASMNGYAYAYCKPPPR